MVWAPATVIRFVADQTHMVSNRIESKRNESSQSHRATRPKYAVNNSQLCDAFEFRTRTLGGGNVCLVYSAARSEACAALKSLARI